MQQRNSQMERWSVGALERGAWSALPIGGRWEEDCRSLGRRLAIVADYAGDRSRLV